MQYLEKIFEKNEIIFCLNIYSDVWSSNIINMMFIEEIEENKWISTIHYTLYKYILFLFYLIKNSDIWIKYYSKGIK